MKCEICKKQGRVQMAHKKLRGHYNPTAKKVKHPNIQWMKLAGGKRVRACAKCLKSFYKTAKIEKPR